MTRWIDPIPVKVNGLETLGLDPLVAHVLGRRGVLDFGAARAFLHPDSVPPMRFPGMEKAAARLQTALRENEAICVWGDFDVDGQTSTALLVQALRNLGAKVQYYIPERAREGHGVQLESLKTILDRGAQLVLTCDTGISAHEAVAYAKTRNVDFVITDHHDVAETLPDAAAVVNPKLLPDGHPLSYLAGVGVAFKLVEALFASAHLETDSLLDLTALGLVADVASLKGETRALVYKGIRVLRETDRLGLKVMAELSATDLAMLTEETIGFALAPRLNALGRLADAKPAVELLLTHDPVRARVIAAQIEGLNTQRRLLTEQVYQAADEQLRLDPGLGAGPIIVLAHPSWPGGVIGIVASRLVERYRKPALLLSGSEQGMLRGSARSIDGLHITRAIAACRKHLVGFGGHPMAAGLSLRADALPQFRIDLEQAVEKMLAEAQLEEDSLEIDQWIGHESVTLDLADRLEELAPFGAGNPIPIFATRAVHVESARELGRMSEHRRLVVSDSKGAALEVLWWNAGEEELPSGAFDLAFSIRPNTFRGERRVAAELKGYRLREERPIKVSAPRVQIVDLRLQTSSLSLPPRCLIWAEGADAAKGSDRFHLRMSDDFAIWTSPPARAELRAALAVVRPQRVYLVATSPIGVERTDDFLTRLAGLTKFALRQRAGKVSVSELSAACAHRELTIRLGLEWLAAGGHISIEGAEDELQISPGGAASARSLLQELYSGVKSLVDETAAYRAYFSTADVNSLI